MSKKVMGRKCSYKDEILPKSLLRYQHRLIKIAPFTLVDLHQFILVNFCPRVTVFDL